MNDADRALLEEAKSREGMTLGELVRELPGTVTIEGDPNVRVFGVQQDSRRANVDDLFVVRQGGTHDARAFVPQAIARGATALLAEHGVALPPSDRPVIRVESVTKGLAYTAAAVYGHPAFSLDIVGITGTNGKTTTTHLVRSAIDGAMGRPLTGIVGTVGHTYASASVSASHTTPEADELARVFALMKKRGASHVAMEVSSIALVLGRVEAVRFRVAAFTNLTQDHLDFHGTMEAYAAAKLSLFTDMAPGLAVVNLDDPFGPSIAKAARCRVIGVRARTREPDADVVAERIDEGPGGMRIVAKVPGARGDRIDMKTRLVGRHNVENLLVALGIVSALELDVERAAEALASEAGAPGRLERCDGEGDDIVVLVDYAHTPDALGRVLEAVRAAARGGRIVCVFGCGGDRDPTKRRPMGLAVGERADVAIVTSDNPRTEDPSAIARPVEEGVQLGLRPATREALAEGDRGYVVELDRQRAIGLAIELAKPGDVVLIAGKGHEDYQIVGHERRAFDDRIEARRALADRKARKLRSAED
jgi:UDP-N-acetylmuramoyl-L-alanyl-D-glutamate--2,6-diaminopimelate ligase